MKEFEILEKIKDIIFSVPGSIYKFEEPEDYVFIMKKNLTKIKKNF